MGLVIFYTINGASSEQSEHKIGVSEANYQGETADAGLTRDERSEDLTTYLTSQSGAIWLVAKRA